MRAFWLLASTDIKRITDSDFRKKKLFFFLRAHGAAICAGALARNRMCNKLRARLLQMFTNDEQALQVLRQTIGDSSYMPRASSIAGAHFKILSSLNSSALRAEKGTAGPGWT